MLKILESKTARIDLELKADPSRSDREIARICGVDHKTVAARRAKLPHSGEMGNSNSPLGENSPRIPHWGVYLPRKIPHPCKIAQRRKIPRQPTKKIRRRKRCCCPRKARSPSAGTRTAT
jgi:hypothetical protein